MSSQEGDMSPLPEEALYRQREACRLLIRQTDEELERRRYAAEQLLEQLRAAYEEGDYERIGELLRTTTRSSADDTGSPAGSSRRCDPREPA